MKVAFFRAAWLVSLIWFLPSVRQAAEANMTVHMLVHLPSVAVSGALIASELPAVLTRLYARADWLGIGSMTFALCVLSAWMLPVALDASLMDGRIANLKYATVLLAGAMVHAAWKRFPPALLLFLLGNAAGMTATAGLLIRQAESRLCVSYLMDQQSITGAGLVVWAALIGCCAIWSWFELQPSQAMPVSESSMDAQR